MGTDWEIIHIPAKLPSSTEQAAVEVIAATIEPKLANTLVRKLNQICPLENLRHAKRVRKRIIEGKVELAVILCLSFGSSEHMEGMPNDLLQLLNNYQLSPFIARVAECPALSKEEWEEQCKLWPTSYHPPSSLDGAGGFSEEDSQFIINFMKVAIQLAKPNFLGGEAVNAAVIVDPMSKQVIAYGSDQTFSLPSTIISSCSHIGQEPTNSSSQPGGNSPPNNGYLVSKLTPNKHKQPYHRVSCLHPWGWTELNPYDPKPPEKCDSDYAWHPLRHAALVAIENAAARDRSLFPNPASSIKHSTSMDNLLQPDDIPSKRLKTNTPENEKLEEEAAKNVSTSEATRPYLCTGFDIFLVWEPCTMCAMALVHQRIRRIFYAFPNPNDGALGSVHRLQGEKSLNHHYSVFRILAPKLEEHI
ncbi:LOW QUALITY PROTEIN: tRNA-specific adenosine deaminase TAD3 [Dioscorea cayenensis subsp. rotundata]|uniref:LOW QUALITY PROTEIN: tRNA-specific adenosine deaminase TAD3 n=1 Tax=Dioscorea cayennensis subsp. rotundata TaxID=55577 RepID=A0AB40ARL2_DIOCR|nr:LOW QUALITY PROTEIN: tRNA-specific adenosine deaminase TAD3 [Dioscorea cayenensis subsp. rotundata]